MRSTAAGPLALFRHGAIYDLRLYLEFPKPGEPTARKSYLTAFAPLGELIEDFNKSLKPEEEKFKISFEAVRVRDALAHGRLVVPEPPSWPATFWKFGKVKDGRMPVEFCEELTIEWMKDQYVKNSKATAGRHPMLRFPRLQRVVEMTIDKGIVSKRLDVPYCSGPCKTWLKSKKPLKRCAGSEKRIGLGPCPRPTVAL